MPNYSFEDYDICPNVGMGDIQHAVGWNNPNNGTADYFNTCVTVSPYYFGAPTNVGGYQFPKTGYGYGGFFVLGYSISAPMEYAQAKLKSTLKPNYHYCVQYFVSRADSIGDYGVSNLGALFTNTIVNSSDPYNIMMTPQIKNPIGRIIIDRKNWTAISGTFTAVGGEQYITIGNFDPKSANDTLYDTYHPNSPFGRDPTTYYYIDDVTVEEVANARAGRDTIINCGDAVTLGADSAIGAYYTWLPSAGLSNDSVAFPIASPTVSTTYVLKKQQCSVITYDTVKVTLNIACPTPSVDTETQIAVTPNVFSPNADNVNDVWKFSLGNNAQNDIYDISKLIFE